MVGGTERVFAEVRGGREDVLGSTAMETLHSQREYADLVRRQGLRPAKTKQLFEELVGTVSGSLDGDCRRTLDAERPLQLRLPCASKAEAQV